MTPNEHITEAQRWLRHAEHTWDDDTDDVGPRSEYSTDEEYFRQMEIGQQLRKQASAEATLLTQFAQAHAAIAQALTAKETNQ